MKAQDLRTKSVEELNNELVNLLGEQFKLGSSSLHDEDPLQLLIYLLLHG